MTLLRRKSNAAPTPGHDQLARLRAAVASLRASNQTLAANNARLYDTNTRLIGTCDELDADLGTARDNERAARRDLAEALEQNAGLNDIVRGLNRALALKQKELDKTLAAFKKLDQDYIETSGRLQDAEERLAGYQKAVA